MSASGKIRIPLREWRSKHWEEERERRAKLATEQTDTKTIAGKFAEALGCLEDAACHLRDIDNQYDLLYPDDECAYPELQFWFALDDAIKPLERIQKGLEAVDAYAPKEVTA